MKFVFFQFRRTEKMDSVMKRAYGAMPPRIFGLEPPLGREGGKGRKGREKNLKKGIR